MDKPSGVTVNSKRSNYLLPMEWRTILKCMVSKGTFLEPFESRYDWAVLPLKRPAQSLYQQQMDDNTFEKWIYGYQKAL